MKFLKIRYLVQCFIILFQIKSVKPSVSDQSHSKYLHFCVFKWHFVVLQPYIILGVFHYFGHHCRPASQIFNPRLSLNYFNPAIILIKKNCALGVLRYSLRWKQPRLDILATSISRFGTKISPNELIFHAQIEEKYSSTLFYKKNQFNQVYWETIEFEDFCPYNELYFKTNDLYSWFYPILLNKIYFFYKKKMCLYRFLLYVRELWAHIDISKWPNLSFKIMAPAES